MNILLFILSWLLAPRAEAAKIDITRIIPLAPGTPGGIGGTVYNIYFWALATGGLLAFAVIVYGAIKYTASGGNPERQRDAKDWIVQALMGLLLLMGGALILGTINPRLSKIESDLGICPPTFTCPSGTVCIVKEGSPTCETL